MAALLPVLARTLRSVDYFTLGFGTMVGVGWLVLMDDWRGRAAGPRWSPGLRARRLGGLITVYSSEQLFESTD